MLCILPEARNNYFKNRGKGKSYLYRKESKRLKGRNGKDNRIATPSALCLIVIGIILPSLKLIGQF